jgi:hypothetical protein
LRWHYLARHARLVQLLWLFGSMVLISTILKQLFERGLELITSLRKNMKGQLMLLSDRILLRKRFIIERSL